MALGTESGKHPCKSCGQLFTESDGRRRGWIFQCNICASAEKQLRRHVGEIPEEMKGMSAEETQGFFRGLHQERQRMQASSSKQLGWNTVRAGLVSSLTTKQIRTYRQEVEGKFLPTSVWVAQGWDEALVLKQNKEWSEALGCDTYQIPVKTLSWSDTYEKTEARVLEHERAAAQTKKGKAHKDGEDPLDVPAAAPAKGQQDQDDQKREASAKKVTRESLKQNALAAKCMQGLTASVMCLEKLEPKLEKLKSEEGYEDLKKTLCDTKGKVMLWSAAARRTLQDHEAGKGAAAPEALEPLPFTQADVKTTSSQVQFLQKSVRQMTPKPAPKQKAAPKKAAAKAASEESAQKRRRCNGKTADHS